MSDLNRILDQIDRLEPELATAPWFVANANEDTEYMPFWQVMNHAYLNDPGTEDDVSCDVEMYVGSKDDAEFIALARTALPQLAQALSGVLDVLDGYTMPGRLHDPTGIAGAEIETLEGYIREAISDALGGDDD